MFFRFCCAGRTAFNCKNLKSIVIFSKHVSQRASENKTFQSGIKLKGFDKSLQMNAFTLNADVCIICWICSKHHTVNNDRGKTSNIYTTELASSPRSNLLDDHLSSDQQRNTSSQEKTQRISIFHAVHQDRISK